MDIKSVNKIAERLRLEKQTNGFLGPAGEIQQQLCSFAILMHEQNQLLELKIEALERGVDQESGPGAVGRPGPDENAWLIASPTMVEALKNIVSHQRMIGGGAIGRMGVTYKIALNALIAAGIEIDED